MDCVHLSLSWRPGEAPTREQMEEAAHSALASLGMANAKAIFVAHNDEDYEHVHIIASKINPDTGRVYDLKGSWRTLSRWAEQYEREHGGIISTRRQDMNELRAAIASRDAGAVLEAMTKQRSTFTENQLERALQKEIQAMPGASAEQIAASRPSALSSRPRSSRMPKSSVSPISPAGRSPATPPTPCSKLKGMCSAPPANSSPTKTIVSAPALARPSRAARNFPP